MFTIIIVNYKNEELTIQYIKKELSKIKSNPHVVIVNNEATKCSDEKLCKSLNAILVEDIESAPIESNCYVISTPMNQGFAKANNLAAKFSMRYLKTDFLLFSNNDIQIIDDDICERLIEKMKADPHIGMIGPKVVGLNGEYQSPEPFRNFLDRYCWMYLSTPFLSKEKKQKRFKIGYAANAEEGFHYKVMGSFFMLRTQDFMECGMMDPNTFLYAEEIILSERLKRIGKGVYYLPTVSIIHAHGGTTNKVLGHKGINRHLLDSETYYYKTYIKTPSWKILIGRLVYKTVNIVKDFIGKN